MEERRKKKERKKKAKQKGKEKPAMLASLTKPAQLSEVAPEGVSAGISQQTFLLPTSS